MDLKAIGVFEFINIQLQTIPKHIFYYLFKPVLYHPIILPCHQSNTNSITSPLLFLPNGFANIWRGCLYFYNRVQSLNFP